MYITEILEELYRIGELTNHNWGRGAPNKFTEKNYIILQRFWESPDSVPTYERMVEVKILIESEKDQRKQKELIKARLLPMGESIPDYTDIPAGHMTFSAYATDDNTSRFTIRGKHFDGSHYEFNVDGVRSNG